VNKYRLAITVVLFSVAFAFVESSVVVYLRDLYYPEGFVFPLKPIGTGHILVELFREFSTIIMLVSIGWLAGTTHWQKMAWFMISFSIWDIFYYVWLKAILNWPTSVFDWDVLFLIPVPWIGPVIAPVLISILLIVAGALILRRENTEGGFRAPQLAWWLAIAGTLCVLYSFTRDTAATMEFAPPQRYWYWLFFVGFGFYFGGLLVAFSGESRRLDRGAD